jgi:hypothetical protein
VAIRVDRINRAEPCPANGACSIELVPRGSAVLRNFRATLSGFAVSCVLLSVAAAQQPPQTSFAATGLVNAPTPSSSLMQSPGNAPGSVNPQHGRLYLDLQQAIELAIKNNLDIEIERVDQTIADQSVPLAKGGGLPRPINYTVADTPAGEGPVAVPLLSFSSPGLSPLSVDPISSTVSSSYNTSRVLDGSHSLSLGTTPYSSGSPVPGFDAQLLGRYGWLRRNPAVSLLSVTPTTPADAATTDNTIGDTLLTKGFGPEPRFSSASTTSCRASTLAAPAQFRSPIPMPMLSSRNHSCAERATQTTPDISPSRRQTRISLQRYWNSR